MDSVKLSLDSGQLEAMLFNKGYSALCGVDEVGRGPLAGPVVAAALVWPEGTEIAGLTDSKKLNPAKREAIFEEIVDRSLVCAVGVIDYNEIDKMNILRASLMAMRKAVMDLRRAPEFVLVDGNFPIPNLTFPQFSVVGGDASCMSIAAASVVAKVTRDRIMDRYEALYPSFNFSQHKGYPTRAHLEELKANGPCEIHRRSFRPVAEMVEQMALL